MSTSRSSPDDALAEARRLAGANDFVIATVSDCINPTSILARQYRTAYVLYRKRVRLGKRSDPAALLRLIKQTLAADREGLHANQSPPVY